MFKNWIIFLLLGVPLITMQAQGQSRGSAAPASLIDKFDDHFPDALNVSWKKDVNGFNVTFKKRKLTMTARYTLNEIWKYTDIILTENLVPKEAIAHLKSNYAGSSILSTGYHDSPEQRYFKLNIKLNNVRRILKYDDDGNFISIK